MKRLRYFYTVQVRDDVIASSREEAAELIADIHALGDNDSYVITDTEEVEDAP